MKYRRISISVTIVFFMLVAGCSSSKETPILPVEVLFSKAMEDLSDEDYLDAIENFKTITIQYPGSEYADDAQFYMAECRYERDEFILAAAEYDVVIRTMTASPFVSRARFRKAMSYYELSPKPSLDQKYTSQAIDEFQTFIEYSPTDSSVQTAEAIIKELNDKLARKEYESARLYYRMEYYRAAIAYYDFVLERYHDSQYADDALLGKAAALYQRFEFDDALATIDAFLFKYGSSELAEDAESLRQEIIAGKEEALRNPKKFAKVSKKG